MADIRLTIVEGCNETLIKRPYNPVPVDNIHRKNDIRLEGIDLNEAIWADADADTGEAHGGVR
jgi:hypothetical protein